MRGQAHTLEAVAAGLIVLASVIFALQVTAVTPLSSSTSSQHIETQQARMAEGILVSELENGTIKPTLLYWNSSSSRFHNASRDGYNSGGPPTPFGGVLNRTFLDRGYAVNVNLYYPDGDGNRQLEKLVNLGDPSDNAASASRTVTIYDDANLRDADLDETDETVTNSSSSHFAGDFDDSSELFTVVDVEVVVWRM